MIIIVITLFIKLMCAFHTNRLLSSISGFRTMRQQRTTDNDQTHIHIVQMCTLCSHLLLRESIENMRFEVGRLDGWWLGIFPSHVLNEMSFEMSTCSFTLFLIFFSSHLLPAWTFENWTKSGLAVDRTISLLIFRIQF